MVGLTREQRAARQAALDAENARNPNRQAIADAKQSSDPFATVAPTVQEQVDQLNAIDERRPNWRPATVLNIDTGETAPDERRFAGDEGRALNQMVGRAAITENTDPQPHITRVLNAPPTVDPYNRPPGEGDEIKLLRGYQQTEGEPKRQAGEVIRVPGKEAKRLVNLGVAKFTEA
jgi:hypothetical protein